MTATALSHAPRGDRPQPGRPRSAAADQAILDATLALVAEVGVEPLTIEAVAARAGVAKATIYRRWSTKDDLIMAALRRVHEMAPMPNSGSLRDDLFAMARLVDAGPVGLPMERLLPRLIGVAGSNPALFRTYLQNTLAHRWQESVDLIERARERGEIRADVDPAVVQAVFLGSAFFARLVLASFTSLPPGFMERVVDALWNGVAPVEGHGRAGAEQGSAP